MRHPLQALRTGRLAILEVLLIVLLAPLVLGAIVFAQSTTPPPQGDLLQVILVSVVVPILGSAFLAFTSWASKRLGDYFAARAKNESNALLHNVYAHMGHLASIAVAEVSQTAVDQLKAASSDGKLTKAEGSAALNAAVKRLWQLMGDEARSILLTQAGGSAANAQTNILTPIVEAAVRAQKTGTPNPNATPSDEGAKARDVAFAQARLGLQ